VSNLLSISLIRSLGSSCGFNKIQYRSGSVMYYPKLFDQKMWIELIKQSNGKYLTSLGSVPYVQEKIQRIDKLTASILKTLGDYLKLLNSDT